MSAIAIQANPQKESAQAGKDLCTQAALTTPLACEEQTQSSAERQGQINPSGLCMCGCGGSVNRSPIDIPFKGIMKGDFLRFVKGHQSKQPTAPVVAQKRIDPRKASFDKTPAITLPPPDPNGRCLCGCGERTTITAHADSVRGLKIGEWSRFVQGHYHNYLRKLKPDWGKQFRRRKELGNTREALVRAVVANPNHTMESLQREVAPGFRIEGVSRMLTTARRGVWTPNIPIIQVRKKAKPVAPIGEYYPYFPINEEHRESDTVRFVSDFVNRRVHPSMRADITQELLLMVFNGEAKLAALNDALKVAKQRNHLATLHTYQFRSLDAPASSGNDERTLGETLMQSIGENRFREEEEWEPIDRREHCPELSFGEIVARY